MKEKIKTALYLLEYYGLVGLLKAINNKIHHRDLLYNIVLRNDRVKTIFKNKNKIQVLYICEKYGFYGTPRYRAYNITEILYNSKKYNVTFAFEDELGTFVKYLEYFKIIVVVRILYNSDSFQFLKLAKEKGLKIVVDLDDKAYDREALGKVFDMSITENRNHWESYADKIQLLLSMCNYVTTTNIFLAKDINKNFKKNTFVLPNSINIVQLKKAIKCKKSRKIIIGYFSGTNTHQKDFQIAAPSVARILDEYPNVYLEIVGELEIPMCLKPYSKQIIKKPLMGISKLQKEIGKVLINLAPLELNDFTNCKSELKFFEAAIAKTITIASPSETFKNAIKDSVNGYIANCEAEWYNKIKNIITGNYDKKVIGRAFNFAYQNYFVKSLSKRVEYIYDSILENKKILIDDFAFTKKIDVAVNIDCDLEPPYNLNDFLKTQKIIEIIKKVMFFRKFFRNKTSSELAGFEIMLKPIHPIISKQSLRRKRINLVIPSINKEHIYGGVTTALNLFIKMIEFNDYDGRIILTSFPPHSLSKEILESFLIVDSSVDSDKKRQIVDLSKRDNKTLFVREDDVFLATFWLTAYIIQDLLFWQKKVFKKTNQKLLYLIQDYEPGFYKWSSEFLLSESTYKIKTDTIALFNSSYLEKYFNINGYHFYKTFNFEPTLNPILREHLLKAKKMSRRKRIIIFYGRKNTPRNAFELIVEALKKWSASFDDKYTWQIFSIGEKHEDIDLPHKRKIKSLGKLSLDAYADILLKSYIGISLMVSPHPSYPPLEMSTFGVKTITNSFANKNLQNFNKNIVNIDDISPNNIANAITTLCEGFDGKAVLETDTSYVKNTNQFDYIVKNIKKIL